MKEHTISRTDFLTLANWMAREQDVVVFPDKRACKQLTGCWSCPRLTYTTLATWKKVKHYPDKRATDIPQNIHLRVNWSRMF